MKFRNLTSLGDWTFGKGLANYVSEDAAIALNIQTRIYSWLNDCFFDLTAGVDWLNRLGSKNQEALLASDLRRIILRSDGVTGLLSFSIDENSRVFNGQYKISTIYSASYQASITLGGISQ